MKTAIILTCLLTALAIAGQPGNSDADIDEFLKSYDFSRHQDRTLDRDQWVHVWFGNLSGEAIVADINERIYLDVYIETSDSAYGAGILLILGTNDQYIDSLLSRDEGQIFYPLDEWDMNMFLLPEGSPPNPEGWSSQSFLGVTEIAAPYDSPWLHLETPHRVLTMVVKTANDSTLAGRLVDAFATGVESIQGSPNCWDTMGITDYPVTQYFNLLQFEGGGSAMGTVTDNDNNPIEGVHVFDVESSLGDYTDSDGDYDIPILTPGTHSLAFVHELYIDTIVTDVEILSDDTTYIDIDLQPSGFLAGMVTDSGSSPLADVDVFAINSATVDTVSMATESDGGFYFDNIHPGYYDLSFTLDLYRDTSLTDVNVIAFDTTSINVVMERIPQNDVGVTAILSPVDSIANGLAYDCIVEIANYQIDTVSFDVVFEIYFNDSSEVTLADTFSVEDMPANSSNTITFAEQFEPSSPAIYNIIAFTTLEFELENSNDTTSSSVTCYNWGCIGGLVTDGSASAIPDVLVEIDGTDIECSTDSLGWYFHDDIPIGTYDLSFSHPNYSDTLINDVLVQYGDTTNLDIEMYGWGDITGTVIDRSGDAISDVYVEIVDTDNDYTTDLTGQYLFEDIEAGVYTLSFSHPDYNDTTITDVTVQHDETTVLDIEFYDWGSLAGTVIDESGDPIENAVVRVMGTSIDTTTDSTGGYVIDNIPAYIYNIRFSHSDYFTVIVPDVSINHDSTTVVDTIMESSVGIDDPASTPDEYSIDQNYPNPFNAVTSFEYALPQDAYVTIIVCDILGHQVATLINRNQPAGYHQVSWNAGANSSGIYFYKIQAGDFSQTRKMTLLK
ncbi:MAG: T9SS type A sorting domain-containing protein [candidate division Zixibacteria bacterium]|nr:T9SS type A sorting domain-containing protein [candidate division Zixibacteria bacterium]